MLSNIKRLVRPKHERRVDFVICGTQRGGTTALFRSLQEHPDICWPIRKEVHFFDSERNFRAKKPRYSEYQSFFNPQSFHKVLGETTPAYMYWYDAPKRIWQYNPNMKLIMILRNPIDRAYSHWNLTRHRDPDVSFWDAIRNERERCRSALPLQHRFFSYVDRGFYVEQLRRLWTYFDERQMLIVRNEDLRSRPQDVIDKICRFLGIQAFPEAKPPIAREPRYPYQGQMSTRERDYLRHVFEYEIRNLERILRWDCSRWLAD